MTQPLRDSLLELLAAVGVPPFRSARLLRAVERANRALALKGLCENCDDPALVEFRYDLQLYLCDSCFAFQRYEVESNASA